MMKNKGNVISVLAIALGVFALGFVAVAMLGQPATAEPATVNILQPQEPASAATCGAGGAACDGSCGGACGGACGAKTCGCGR